MSLLVDIGNSRLKWGFERGGFIECQAAVDYRRYDGFSRLEAVWSKLPAPRKLAIASVASSSRIEEVSALAARIWPAIEIVVPRSTAMAFGVRNAYQQPDKLGIDRWLAMLAAHRYYPGGACVADCGTAITVDVIDANGMHLGGVISLGLESMKKALAANTEALKYDSATYISGLANHTAAAIASGTLLAAAGLIERVVRRQDRTFRLILTGGDADVIFSALDVPAILDHELVFKGLNLFCDSEAAQ